MVVVSKIKQSDPLCIHGISCLDAYISTGLTFLNTYHRNELSTNNHGLLHLFVACTLDTINYSKKIKPNRSV